VVGTYGIAQDQKFTFSNGLSDAKGNNPSSYSAGVEGGVRLGMFLLGGELGYLNFIANDITQNTSTIMVNGPKAKFDLSGTYIKIQLGISFI